MNTLRRVVFILLLVIILLAAMLFAHNNPEPINVDMGVARFEQVPAAVAFTAAFAFGWAFGLLSASIGWARLAAERLRLRRELRRAQAEIRNLRNLRLIDAD